MGRPFVAEGGFGLGRKTCGLMVLWGGPQLPHPKRPLNNNNNNIEKITGILVKYMTLDT